MPLATELQTPAPKTWQLFECLCCELFRLEWGDPHTSKNGRSGQNQQGVDVFGRPKQRDQWAGVQCKGKDNYAKKKVTRKELVDEVEKAKTFDPPLSSFILATTGPRDAKVQALARKLTNEHLSKGLFTVMVMAWEDLLELLDYHPELLERYCSVATSTRAIKQALAQFETSVTYAFSSQILDAERHTTIEQAKKRWRENHPSEAKRILEDLRQRTWSTLPDNTRFRLETNLALVHLELHEEQKAAEFFLSALSFKADDSDAIANAAFANALLDQREKARELAQKVISKNPLHYIAHCVLIDQADPQTDFDTVLDSVPTAIRGSGDIAFTLGRLASRRGLNDQSIEWNRKALADCPELRPTLVATLGQSIFCKIASSERVRTLEVLNAEERSQLEEAEELVQKAWDALTNVEDKRPWSSWLTNLGLIRKYLGKLPTAERDLRNAYELDPECSYARKQIGQFLQRQNRHIEVITLYQGIVASCLERDEILLLAEVYANERMYQKALTLIEDSKFIFVTSEDQRYLSGLRCEILFLADQVDDALQEAGKLQSNPESGIRDHILVANISRRAGKEDSAKLALAILPIVNEKTSVRDLLLLADEFYFHKLFEQASSLYESALQGQFDRLYSLRLLNCFQACGLCDKALSLCESINESAEATTYSVELHASILEDVGDLRGARAIIKRYLATKKSGLSQKTLKLRLAMINARLNERADVESFIEEQACDYEQRDLCIRHARLVAHYRPVQEALQLLYELRRKYSHDPEMHAEYVLFFLAGRVKLKDLVQPHPVGPDCVAWIAELGKKAERIVIEERSDSDFTKRELHVSHKLSQLLIGKKRGDQFEYQPQEAGLKKTYKITRITSKYLFAFRESSELAKTVHHELSSIKVIETGKPTSSGEPPPGFGYFLDTIKQGSRRSEEILGAYKQRLVSVGMVAELIGRSIYETMGYLQMRADLGIRSWFGNDTDWDSEKGILQEGECTLVVDPLTLPFLHEISQSLPLKLNRDRFAIVQSTLDELDRYTKQPKPLSQERLYDSFLSRGTILPG